ncbi:MAG: hypothetical protein IIY32_09920 [Thermoguttaceae bacterium]|nr:hypothetical protein [Thermoguttaceae bacterium]
MMRRFHKRARRSGVTLVELLVVATVMLTLAAVSVPAIKPMMESQLTSSAASTVSTYLNRARARAMATGRPCGVTFEYFPGTCDEGDPDDPDDDVGSASLVLRQVEVPPYYCGLETDSVASVIPGNDFVINGQRLRQLGIDNDPYWKAFMEGDPSDPNDDERSASIQFNNCGPFYPIRQESGNYYIEKLPGLELPSRLNVPFKVSRDPRPTMTAPVGVPSGTVVDLEFSGEETSGFALDGDVTVIFSPTGEVNYVEDKSGRFVPTDTLYFLIGRWDRISALGVENDPDYGPVSSVEDGLWNFEDGTNFWVTVNPRTGLVSTVEVNPPVNYAVGDWGAALDESREFGRMSKRNLGGH